MPRLTRSLMPAVFLLMPLLAAPLSAADEEVVDISHYLCKDLMRMSETERAISMGVLHGYLLGKKGKTSVAADELSALSNEFIEYCLDHPHEKAMASFEKLAK